MKIFFVVSFLLTSTQSIRVFSPNVHEMFLNVILFYFAFHIFCSQHFKINYTPKMFFVSKNRDSKSKIQTTIVILSAFLVLLFNI